MGNLLLIFLKLVVFIFLTSWVQLYTVYAIFFYVLRFKNYLNSRFCPDRTWASCGFREALGFHTHAGELEHRAGVLSGCPLSGQTRVLSAAVAPGIPLLLFLCTAGGVQLCWAAAKPPGVLLYPSWALLPARTQPGSIPGLDWSGTLTCVLLLLPSGVLFSLKKLFPL